MSGLPTDHDDAAAEGTEAGGAVWSLYMIRCRGGFLYTGITTDIDRRFAEHQAGKGAKYLRGRGPLELVYRERIGSRSAALKREAAVKKLSRPAKEALMIAVNA